MVRPSKDVRDKWVSSAKRVLGARGEVRYVGSHPSGIKLTLRVSRGTKVSAQMVRDLAATIGMTDKKAIDLLVKQSAQSGSRVLQLGGQTCECFVVSEPGHPPQPYCLLCTHVPPFRCREHPSCHP